jgi:Mn2+/Fe2+ NRAMP family transporter
MNNKKILGDFRNNLISNIIGGIVVLIAVGLGVRSILVVLGIL